MPPPLAPPRPAARPVPVRAHLWLARAAGAAAACAVWLPAVLAAPAGAWAGPASALCAAVAWWVLVVEVIRSDLASYVIPDEASAAIAALGIAAVACDAWLSGGEPGPAARAAAAVGAGAFAVFWLTGAAFRRWGRDALGFGDVKLAGACAVWLAPADAAAALEVAAVGALLALLIERRRGARLVDTAVPFGAFLAPAAWLVHLLAPTMRALLDAAP